MELFDTHTHLLDERFDPDRDEVLLSIQKAGVTRCVEACCDAFGIDKVVDLCSKTDFVYGSVGIHPHSAGELSNEVLDKMADRLGNSKIVAVGEIGLDYHYDFFPRNVQRDCFASQLELARRMRVPVIIHDREAHGDCMDILRAYKNGLCGIMHCFSGSYETARECLDLGLYIAFGGSLTFKNAHNLQDVARRLPADRIVIETDCPYMTPVPHRGERNDPSYIHHTLEMLAELLGMSTQQLAPVLYSNSCSVFGI
ncbi:MAG: TatD family hydrolase [Eubacteriales bacterium]|nr:TatD family hydrolase [Eubacteriales bacterium]